MKKNKVFPKAKKKLQKFLLDENGKITKKDALGLSAGLAILSSAENAFAGHTSSYSTNTSPVTANPFPDDPDVPNNGSETNTWTIVDSATCNHASGLINGHYSNVPMVNIVSEQIDYTKSHASHSSHGSHSSGGWC